MFSRCLFATTTMVALFAGLARAQDLSFGRRIFHEKADCQFCHGIDGDERGDPRSDAAYDDAVFRARHNHCGLTSTALILKRLLLSWP
jgi:mono/diheme cytochrome c family protein